MSRARRLSNTTAEAIRLASPDLLPVRTDRLSGPWVEESSLTMLSIVMCVDTLEALGGTERQVVRLLKGLKQRGADPLLISRWPLRTDNLYVSELRALSIPIMARGWLGAGNTWNNYPGRLHHRLRRQLHLQYDGSDAWRWQFRQLRRIRGSSAVNPVVHEIPVFGHTSPPACRLHTKHHFPVVQTTFGLFPGLVARPVAPWSILTADSEGSYASGERYRWIPSMGPDPATLPSRPTTTGTRRVVYAGRLTHQKGIGSLIQALRGMHDVELTCAGLGPDEQSLKSAAEEAEITATFPGFLSEADVLKLLASADVAVLPSRSGEGVPSFVVEALAVGTPVVASRVGGLERTLSSVAPWGARLVEPDDVHALRTGIRAMLDAGSAEVSAGLYEHYLETFSPDSVLDLYLAAYEEARQQLMSFR